MQDFYTEGTYLINNPSWHEEDSPWKAKKIIKIIKRNNLKPSTICEIGCGAGEILRQLSINLDKDIQYFGYEISSQAFKLCQQKQKKNLTFNFKDLLKENEVSFDIVMAADVFEHVEDYLGFLRQLKTKGTYYIFHIPLDISVLSVLRGWPFITARKSVGHIHYSTKDTALATLEDTGYEVLDYFYTGSALELPNLSWKRKLLVIPRRLLFFINQNLAVRVLGGYSLLVLAK